ncbi:YveK family protein [Thermaerobacter subterraneus]|uniref:Capsular polysaccharide biosynthesis protein n=1 Tax=Thermaerobacter subterraneus DSM 13965 TaxID=867903 RepID=K6PZA6_9FIRM|nr:Wzz/FepE/Etk N-terminal domain-containing protein [Thermaerobacter subterraneus]EKP94108.1 capsular polysaccharide biosynthesis protein [Thermaerobacter subterraneus DSM 13965]
MSWEVGDASVSVGDLMSPIFRRWRTVALLVVFSILVAVVRIIIVTPEFEAKARLIVLAPNEAVTDLQTLQLYRNLVPAYQEILSSRRVMVAVLQELKLDWSPSEYRRRVRIEAHEESQTLDVVVRAGSPAESAWIATAAAQVMTRVAADVMQEERLVLLDPAAPPEKPVTPRPVLELVLASVLGLMVGTGVIFALEMFDRRIRDEVAVERRLGLPVLGVIPHIDL